MVIISSFIILTIGAAVAFVTFFENQTAFSARKADEALAAAQAGANDALQKILRDRAFSQGDYQLAVDGATASTTVAWGAVCSGSAYRQSFTVTSTGSAQNRQRRIRAVISHNCETGHMAVASMREIEI